MQLSDSVLAQAKQAGEAVELLNEYGHGTPVFDPPHVSVDAFGKKLTPSDLSDENKREERDFALRNGFSSPLPVYLEIHNQSDVPITKLVTDEKGEPGILINEAAHQWTDSYTEKQRETDAELKEKIKDGFLKEATSQDVSQSAIDDIQAISQKMGNVGRNAPKLFIMPGDDLASSRMESGFTREGTNFIKMNQAAAAELKDAGNREIVESNIWHEEAHIVRKDASTATQTKMHNDPNFAKEIEHQTDLLAFGPKGSNDSAPYIRNLENIRKIDYQKFKKDNPNGTEAEFDKAYADPRHPSFAERKAYLEQMMKLAHPTGQEHKDIPLPTRPSPTPGGAASMSGREAVIPR